LVGLIGYRAAENRGHFLCGPLSNARHLATELSTGTASFGATSHKVVIAHLLTTAGAAFTDLGASSAGMNVQLRLAQHEVRADLADLGTIGEQADMVCLGEAAAFAQAVGKSLQADAVTSHALFDTGLHT
jgi:hypothetical protein